MFAQQLSHFGRDSFRSLISPGAAVSLTAALSVSQVIYRQYMTFQRHVNDRLTNREMRKNKQHIDSKYLFRKIGADLRMAEVVLMSVRRKITTAMMKPVIHHFPP